MTNTMPRSALRHRTIGTSYTLPPVALRASKTQEPLHEDVSPAHDQASLWTWW